MGGGISGSAERGAIGQGVCVCTRVRVPLRPSPSSCLGTSAKAWLPHPSAPLPSTPQAPPGVTPQSFLLACRKPSGLPSGRTQHAQGPPPPGSLLLSCRPLLGIPTLAVPPMLSFSSSCHHLTYYLFLSLTRLQGQGQRCWGYPWLLEH